MQIALIILIKIEQYPFPKNKALIYIGGNLPLSSNTEDYIIALHIPNGTNNPIITHNETYPVTK